MANENGKWPLPEGWEWTTLEESVDVFDRLRVPINGTERDQRTAGVSESELIPYYGATGQVGWIDDYIFDEELVLLGEDGAPFLDAYRDTAYIIRGKSWVNNHAHVLKAVDGLTSNSWICHYLNVLDYGAYVTGTTRLKLNQGRMKQIPIPIAPLPEQERIVAEIEKQFTRLDTAVAALERVQAGLTRYKASVLKAAVEGRLVPQDPAAEPADVLLQRILAERRAKWEAAELEKMAAKGQTPQNDKWKAKYKEPQGPDTADLPELPVGWVWATVEQLGEVRLGRQRSPKNHQGPHMRPYLRAANATWDGVDLTDVMEMNFEPHEFETYRLQMGDILLSEASGSADEVGKPFIWKEQLPAVAFQNTLIRVRLDQMNPDYLYYHFYSDARTGRFGRISKGVGIHHLGAQRLAEMPVALPPQDEQARIVEELERRFAGIQGAEKSVNLSLARAERQRQSILQKAFRGELVDQNPNDEPASVLLQKIGIERKARAKSQTKEKRRKASLKEAKVTERRSLYDTLVEAGREMTPEELASVANVITSEKLSIDAFYEELREEILSGRIAERRPNETLVFLEAAGNENQAT